MATDLASDIEYLKSLEAVRERSRIVLDRARNGGLNNFIYDESRMKETAEFVTGVISVCASIFIFFPEAAYHGMVYGPAMAELIHVLVVARLWPRPIRRDPAPWTVGAFQHRRRPTPGESCTEMAGWRSGRCRDHSTPR